MRYPKRHSTYGRVKVKTIQLFLGKYNILQSYILTFLHRVGEKEGEIV